MKHASMTQRWIKPQPAMTQRCHPSILPSRIKVVQEEHKMEVHEMHSMLATVWN
jgi:hypothetical protein